MASIFVEILEGNFLRSLALMEAAVRDCPDDLWDTPMWDVPAPGPEDEVRGAGGGIVTGAEARLAAVQRYATPWAIAWHALERFDFMLTGGFVPWEIWPGFEGRTGWTPPPVRSVWDRPYGGLDVTTLAEPWSRDDLVGFTGYCRQRVADTLDGLTDERATTPIGSRGEPYVGRLIDKMGHVIEHGAQIRQFITAAAVTGGDGRRRPTARPGSGAGPRPR